MEEPHNPENILKEYILTHQPGDVVAFNLVVKEALVGGMSEVYLCEADDQVPIAVKTLQRQYFTGAKIPELFAREAELWSELDHPHIVKCTGIYYEGPRPYLVMERVFHHGLGVSSLKEYLASKRGGLGIRNSLHIAIHICRGLAYAQKKIPGIVHRDLKPANILIGDHDIAKIADFGIAGIFLEAQLETTAIDLSVSPLAGAASTFRSKRGVVGTPLYMAPEQWLGAKLDQRTDIYAIGCVLYEMVTNMVPYFDETIEDIRRYHINSPVPQIQPEGAATNALNKIIQRCMEKNKEDRFETADDLLGALMWLYNNYFGRIPLEHESSEEDRVSRLRLQAYSDVQLEKYDRMMARMAEVIRLEPNNPDHHALRGYHQFELKRYEGALQDYQTALEYRPQSTDYLVEIGKTYLALKDFDAAVRSFESALELSPESILPRLYLSYLAFSQGQVVSARENFLKAYRASSASLSGMVSFILDRNSSRIMSQMDLPVVDPNDYLSFLEEMAGPNDRVTTARLLIGIARGDTMTDILPEDFHSTGDRFNKFLQGLQAQQYLHNQDYAKAIEHFTPLLEQDPLDHHAHRARAKAFEELEMYDQAIEDLEFIIRLGFKDAETLWWLGKLLEQTSRIDAALIYYQAIIRIDPEFPGVKGAAGSALVITGEVDKGIDLLQQAVESEPNESHHYYWLAVGYEKSNMVDKARDSLKKCAELTGEPQDEYDYLDYLLRTGEHEAAYKGLTILLEKAPDFSMAYMDRGIAAGKLGLSGENIADFERAIAVDPENAAAYYNLGVTWLRDANYEQALHNLEQALRRGNDKVKALAEQAIRVLNDEQAQQIGGDANVV